MCRVLWTEDAGPELRSLLRHYPSLPPVLHYWFQCGVFLYVQGLTHEVFMCFVRSTHCACREGSEKWGRGYDTVDLYVLSMQ